MTTHSLRIDFDGTHLAVTVSAHGSYESDAGPRPVYVSLPLNFDPAKPAPELKRRKGESDAKYAARKKRTLPVQIDLSPALAASLPAALTKIIEAVAAEMASHVKLAAARHLLADTGGESLNDDGGVTKQLKIETTVAPPRGDVSAG